MLLYTDQKVYIENECGRCNNTMSGGKEGKVRRESFCLLRDSEKVGFVVMIFEGCC